MNSVGVAVVYYLVGDVPMNMFYCDNIVDGGGDLGV